MSILLENKVPASIIMDSLVWDSKETPYRLYVVPYRETEKNLS